MILLSMIVELFEDGVMVISLIDVLVLFVGSVGFSSVIDNILFVVMLVSIFFSLDVFNDFGLWWLVIFGVNLGGNLILIGFVFMLVVVIIMYKYELKMLFVFFVKMVFFFVGV